MARRPPPFPDLPPELTAAISALGVEELQEVTGQLLDLSAARARRRMRPERVSRRRSRSRQEFSVTVRVDLHGATPKTWRRVELPSTLRLSQLHEVLQLLFGWSDGHLHRFTQGSSVWDRDAEMFLCPYDVEEGEDEGVPAADVRLDEVLAEPGDRLRYVYDYGDEWTLVLAVEQVGLPVQRPRCTGGRGTAPPEDSGGVGAWNDAPDDDAGTPFDPAELDDDLAHWASGAVLPPELAELRRRVVGTPAGSTLQQLVDDADLSAGPDVVDEAEAADMVRPYAWLLDRVGAGLRLTSAGWLPPAVVTAASTELGLDREWVGACNREDQTWPVAALRASAVRLGLLRVRKGTLLRTQAGARLTGDALGLWRHVAQRAAGSPRAPFARTATSLVLLAVAAGRSQEVELGEVLRDAGWQRSGGAAPDRWDVRRAAEHTVDVLDAVRAHGGRTTGPGAEGAPPTEGARALARAALKSLSR